MRVSDFSCSVFSFPSFLVCYTHTESHTPRNFRWPNKISCFLNLIFRKTSSFIPTMPKVNSFNASSLENLCLMSVSDNIDKWWLKYHKSCQDSETLSHGGRRVWNRTRRSDRLAIVSPFDCLSTRILSLCYYFIFNI